MATTTGSGPSQGRLARFFTDRGIQCRLAALVLSGTEAVFLKKALHASSAVPTFLVWCVLGLVVSGVVLALVGSVRSAGTALANHRGSFLALALTTGLMQLCTLLVLEEMQVGYALALFQTSTLISVYLGHRVFRERHMLPRLAGSAVMVGGAVLILVGG